MSDDQFQSMIHLHTPHDKPLFHRVGNYETQKVNFKPVVKK